MVLIAPERVEQCGSHFSYRWVATEERTKRCRWRRRGTWLAEQGRHRRLVTVDENGSVLKQSALLAPLCAAGELPSRDHQLAGRRSLEARRKVGLWCPRYVRNFRGDAKRPEPIQQ
jgi:hypothetical protein